LKKKLVTIVIVVLFVVGGCLLLLDPIQSFLIKRINDDLLQASAEEMKKNDEIGGADVSFDFNDAATLSIEDVLKAQLNRDDIYALGSIVVPSVKLQLPIVKGVSKYALAVGAGTMKPDQKMGQGNYALAGHYFKDKNDLLFSPLYGADIGDSVFITNKTSVYEYKISSKNVIAATDVHIIDDVRDAPLLTLITCANDGVDRLAIQAQFMTEHSFDEIQDELFE
jgi:sortase A